MPTAVLALVCKTDFFKRITRNRLTAHFECWGAETTEGVWSCTRENWPGTPWLVYHQPSVKDGSYPLPVTMCGPLRACRAFVGSGAAERELEWRKAEAQVVAVARGCDPACRFPFTARAAACPATECSHPQEPRGSRIERGTFDYYRYETCGARGAERICHDEDGCDACSRDVGRASVIVS
jgi:hypothetical protein